MTISLTYEEKIAVLDLGADENRFSPDFLDEIDARLDEVVGAGAQGLVTTGSGKFYTNGLDLDWLTANGERTAVVCRTRPGHVGPDAHPARPHRSRCWSATPSAPGQCWPWRTTFG